MNPRQSGAAGGLSAGRGSTAGKTADSFGKLKLIDAADTGASLRAALKVNPVRGKRH